MRIVAVGAALPETYYDQEQLIAALGVYWGERFYNRERFEQLQRNVLVGGRHLALPLERYGELSGFGATNDEWIRVGLELGERATREALAASGLAPADVDAIWCVSVTGIATPSLDARLANRLDFPSRIKRNPIFGLGCVAGAAGLSRAADYVRAFPDQVALLLSVELCSLTIQREDLSIANLIASGLFGDGAAAAVVVGADRAREMERNSKSSGGVSNPTPPEIVATRSIFYRDSERVMGWDVGASGFRIVLSAEVPKVVERHLRGDVDAFLAEHGLIRADIASWVAHPGGPKVLEAMQSALELPEDALELTWKSLREVGNLSSTSVLLVLRDTLAHRRPPPGSWGLLLAMGPGFCSELVLLRW